MTHFSKDGDKFAGVPLEKGKKFLIPVIMNYYLFEYTNTNLTSPKIRMMLALLNYASIKVALCFIDKKTVDEAQSHKARVAGLLGWAMDKVPEMTQIRVLVQHKDLWTKVI